MIKRQILLLILRIIVSSFGIWLCVTWFGTVNNRADLTIFVIAGTVFSLVNLIVKPLVKVMTLPLAILTMGISSILINIAMLWLTLQFLPGVEMSFWGIFLSSLVLSVINSLVNLLVPAYNK